METSKRLTILIAEKADDARTLIKEAVLAVDKKALVIEANDSAKAEFKGSNQVFDLIILSSQLPGKGGVQLLKTFGEMDKKRKPKSIILLTTGLFDPKWAELFTPTYHIEKPFEAKALQALVETALSFI